VQGLKSSPLLPDHVLSAILTLAKRESGVQRFAFRGHDFQLQEIFSDLTRSGKYPILQGFVFSDNGPEPYSPVLNESVSKLQLSGLIGRENPDYEVLFLRPAAEKFYDETLAGRFSAPEIAQLRQVAGEFLGKIGLTGKAG
jgi:hypothetical protein